MRFIFLNLLQSLHPTLRDDVLYMVINLGLEHDKFSALVNGELFWDLEIVLVGIPIRDAS